MLDVIDAVYSLSFSYNIQIIRKTSWTLYIKSKFENSKKFLVAFEKHADDVTFGGVILPKLSKVVRKKKKKTQSHVDSTTKTLVVLALFKENWQGRIFAPPLPLRG